MELIALAVLCGLVAGFISFSTLSLTWVIGLSVTIICGPLVLWSCLFVRQHPGQMGVFLLMISVQIGSSLGLLVGYIIKILWA